MERMVSLYTRRDYDALPEGYPAELIDGWLIREPAPTYDHQRLAGRILGKLQALVGPDMALASPVDVLVDDVNVFQPDVVVLRAPPAGSEHYVGVPLIAVEVLSPSSESRDREVKARRLIGLGVEEVWLVDPRKRLIELIARDAYQLSDDDSPCVSRALPGFELSAGTLFTPPETRSPGDLHGL